MTTRFKIKLILTSKKIISWLVFIDCLLFMFCCKSFSQIKEKQVAFLQSQIQFENSQRKTMQLLAQAEQVFSQQGQSLKQITQWLENPWDVNKFLNNLTLMSEKNNVSLLSIKPLEMKKIKSLQILPFEVKGCGDYFAVITWLKLLKNLNAAVVFNSVTFSAVDEIKHSGDIGFDIIFDVLKI
jgi:hypothetical protein